MDERIERLVARARAVPRYLVIGGVALLAIFVFALFALNRAPVPGDNVHVVTATDIAVYRAFLDQAYKEREHFLFVPSGQPLSLVCVNKTADPQMLPRTTFRKEYTSQDFKNSNDFPLLDRSLLARNSVSVPIPSFGTSVLATDTPSQLGLSSKREAWKICFSLPAYSSDGATALVFYHAESGSVMTSGTCVLKRPWWSWCIYNLNSGGLTAIDN